MKSKKGFTLVELLIVIVVIGILSAMMMLSSTEAVSSAKAAKIINNLRQWKTAALAWYVDNIDRVTDTGQIKNATHIATGQNFTGYGNFCENVDILDIAKYFNGEFTKDGASRGTAKYGGTPVRDGAGLSYFLEHLGKDNKFKWYIGCNFGNDTKVKEKLEARAATANLVQRNFEKTLYKANGEDETSGGVVYIEIMDFSR